MRRLTLAVAAAALMALSLAPAASAKSTPFAGVWVSTDLSDGSTQLLTVSGGSALTVTYQDFDASVCADVGGSTHWVATGSGTLMVEQDGTLYGMAVQFKSAGCGSYRWADGYPAWYFFNGEGTLSDNFGNAWYPLR
jgi:hypothetical protein